VSPQARQKNYDEPYKRSRCKSSPDWPYPPSSPEQRAKIFELLLRANGGWVALPVILELNIAQFGARILELRRAGHRIENRTETIGGVRHSWYRLEYGLADHPPSPAVPVDELPLESTLFPTNSPRRWVDPEDGGYQ
jgi:hypothetical protein